MNLKISPSQLEILIAAQAGEVLRLCEQMPTARMGFQQGSLEKLRDRIKENVTELDRLLDAVAVERRLVDATA